MATKLTLTAKLFGNTTSFVAAMRDAGAAIKAAADDLNDFEKGFTGKMLDAGKKSRDFADKLTAVTSRVGQSMRDAGASSLGALSRGANEAIRFEEAMSQVGIVSGLTGKGLKEVEDIILQLGATTAFTATEVAEGAAELFRGGFKKAQVEAGGLEAALAGAAAGIGSVEESAKIAAISMNLFGDSVKDPNEALTLFLNAANSSSTSVSRMGIAFKTAASAAAGAGVPFREFVASVGLVADAGHDGERGGTKLKALMRDLVQPTDTASGVLKRLGLVSGGTSEAFDKVSSALAKADTKIDAINERIEKKTTLMAMSGKTTDEISKATAGLTFDLRKALDARKKLQQSYAEERSKLVDYNNVLFDAKGNFVGVERAVKEFSKALEKLPTQQARLEALGGLSVESIDAILGFEKVMARAAAAGGEAFRDKYADMKALGDITETLKKSMDNTGGSLKKLTSTWSLFLIRGFIPFLQQARPFIDKLTEILAAMAAWAEKNPELTTGLLNLAFAGSALLVVLGTVTIALGTLIGFWVTLKTVATPVFLFVKASALGAAAPLSAVVGIVAVLIAGFVSWIFVLNALGVTVGDVFSLFLFLLSRVWQASILLLRLLVAPIHSFFLLITGDFSGAAKVWTDLLGDFGKFASETFERIIGQVQRLIGFLSEAYTTLRGLENTRGQRAELGAAAIAARESRLRQAGNEFVDSPREFRRRQAAGTGSAPASAAGTTAPATAGTSVNVGAINVQSSSTPQQTAAAILARLQALRNN